jgi:hypothetical protein
MEVTPISETMKKGEFISGSIYLNPGSHTLTIIAKDSEGSIAKMDVIIVVSEISIERKNIPPQIFLININIQEKTFTITIEVIDEDPQSVELQIEEYPNQEFEEIEVTSISDSMKKGIFVSGPIPYVSGIQTLTITARDSQGEETSKEIPIGITDTNQLPQIISLEYEEVQNNYTIKTKIHDEDLYTATVKIKGKPDVTFRKQITSGNESTFISDPMHLDPGLHLFTIVVTNSRNESTEMQIIINVPKKNAIGLLMPLLLVLLPVAVVIAFLLFRKNPAGNSLEEANPVGIKEPEPVLCPSCKKGNVKEAFYCRHCGTPLKPVDVLEKKGILLDLEKRLKKGEISEEEYNKLKEKFEKSF